MTTDEKLQHFLTACIDDATAQSTDVIDKYKAFMEEDFKKHEERAKEEAEYHIKSESLALIRSSNKEISKKQLELMREFSEKNEELKDMLFVEVKDMLEVFMASPKYTRLITEQIQAAKTIAKGAPFIVYLDPADEDNLHNLELNTGISLKMSDVSFGGGTKVVIPSRNILIDNSFDSLLSQVRAEFSFNKKFKAQ